MVPPVYLSQHSGDIAINANSPGLFLVNSPTFEEDPPPPAPLRLGTQFLTAAYLMVNHDAKKFYLWPVRAVIGVTVMAGLLISFYTSRRASQTSSVYGPEPALPKAPVQESGTDIHRTYWPEPGGKGLRADSPTLPTALFK